MAIANLGNLEMKKVLLGTSALLGVGLLAGTAAASDGVKLSLGGFMRSYYGMTFDDDGDGDRGHDRNLGGLGTDAEVYFTGSVTLDNGITVGARIELEGEDENDQIDAAYAYFKGGFGEIRIGSVDGAASNMYMLPPGSTSNFGPYSPNTLGSAISPGAFGPQGMFENKDKAQKIVYYSPTWSGFSFGLSYTPNDDEEQYNDGDNADGTFHPDRSDDSANHNVGVGLHYDYAGEGWNLVLGGAAYFEGDVEETVGNPEGQGYNAGVNLGFGGLTVGAAFTFLNDINGENDDIWAVGTGLSYNVDAWTVGAGWAHTESEIDGLSENRIIDRLGVTGSYAMGPGITLDAGVFHSWASTDEDDTAGLDDYDSIEFSVGSSISF